MTFETDLRTRLLADGTISGIVGTRVYWEVRPQNTPLPAIILNEAFESFDQHFEGPMGTQYFRTQFDCMAKTKAEAVALRTVVRALVVTPSVAGDTEFQGASVESSLSRTDDTADGIVRTAAFDANVWFNETVS